MALIISLVCTILCKLFDFNLREGKKGGLKEGYREGEKEKRGGREQWPMGNNKITQSVVIQDYHYNGNNHENLILGLPKQTTKQNKKN